MPRAEPLALVSLLLLMGGCRIERVTPHGGAGAATECSDNPAGELWVYTSIYRHVLDQLTPLVAERLPGVKINWYQAGSEKIASRLQAELAAGGTQADVLAMSDPFLVHDLKERGLLARHVSVHALRVPRDLLDLDGYYTATRVGAMVLVAREDLPTPPESFRALTEPRFAGRVAIGDALTSGTASTWAQLMAGTYGTGFFSELRANRVTVAGGNAAVLQKVESGEAQVGVMLLENAVAARGRGSRIKLIYPSDGAVVIPGYAALLASSKNLVAARAFVDVLLSPEGQAATVQQGDMHAADPRQPGPRGEPGLEALLARSLPWNAEVVARGAHDAAAVKAAFAEAFSRP